MSRIFISHSTAQNAAALAIAEWLKENGWGEYFLDIDVQQGLQPGERWQQALRSAADRCEAVVFLISPEWRESRWCLAEFLLAKQLGKTTLGVLIDRVSLDTLPPDMTSDVQLCDLVNGSDRRVFTVEHDPIVPRTAVSFATDGLTRLKFGLQRAGLDPLTFAWPPEHDPARAPYRGLKALEPEDAAVFFGRDSAITRGLDALRQIRTRRVEGLFAILGASGAGKSSYLRAGLWPRLARDDREFLPLPIIRPQSAPVTGSTGLVWSLDAAFRACNVTRTRADIRNVLARPEGLQSLISELRAEARRRLRADNSTPTVLLPVDQGEELFSTEGAETDAFLEMLAHVVRGLGGRGQTADMTVVIVTIRSDSYERLQSNRHLTDVAQVPFNLSPIPPAEYKQIIVGPAQRATHAGRKLRLDPVLVDRLLDDTQGSDALPLLAFTLERLYVEYGGDGELSAGDYDALGGVRGSIEAAVDAAFVDPGRAPVVPSDKVEREALLRRAFIPWLARIDPETDARMRRVAAWDEIPREAHAVVERLINARLLIRDQRVVEAGTQRAVIVEVAHEALLRQWPTLTRWLDEDSLALKAIEGARRAAAEWTKSGRTDEWLVHTGERLQTAEALSLRPDVQMLLGEGGREYLQACGAREQRVRAEREAQLERIAAEQARTARAQKRSAVLLVAIAVVLLVFAGWTIAASRGVALQRSSVLVVAAEDAAGKRLGDRALRYAVLAARGGWFSPTVPESEGQLARIAHHAPELSRVGWTDTTLWATFTPDGERILQFSEDRTLRISAAITGQELARFVHDTPTTLKGFSPDGRHVVVTGPDHSVRVLDSATGRELWRMAHQREVLPVNFSADGRRMLTVSYAGDTARLTDTGSGQIIRQLTQDRLAFGALSRDGERVVLTSDGSARVIDVRTGNDLLALENVGKAWFSPLGDRIVTIPQVVANDIVRVVDVATGSEITRVAHTRLVSSAEFSADGQRILTASQDNTAKVWDAATGKELAAVTHDEVVFEGVFSPNGQRFATASADGSARVIDARTGEELGRVTHGVPVRSVAFTPDGERIITDPGDGPPRLSLARQSRELARVTHEDGLVSAAALSPDGQRLLTLGFDATARISDAATGRELTRISHDDVIVSARLSADGRTVVTASTDKTARIWDVQSGKELARTTHAGAVLAAAVSPNGQRLLTIGADNTVRMSDPGTGREIFQFAYDGELLFPPIAFFSPDGQRILTTADVLSARLTDAATGKQIAVIKHTEVLSAAAFSPDGRRLATVHDKTLRVSDADSGNQMMEVAYNDSPQSVAFSPDGRRLLTTSGEVTRVSDAFTGKQILLIGNNEGITQAAFSADGRRVATASLDNVSRLYDAETGKPLAEFSQGEPSAEAALVTIMSLTYFKRGPSAVFSRDGQRLLTAGQDDTARLWDTSWLTRYRADLIDAVCRQRLVGTRWITAEDVAAAPVLTGREGEDVCGNTSVLQKLVGWFRR